MKKIIEKTDTLSFVKRFVWDTYIQGIGFALCISLLPDYANSFLPYCVLFANLFIWRFLVINCDKMPKSYLSVLEKKRSLLYSIIFLFAVLIISTIAVISVYFDGNQSQVIKLVLTSVVYLLISFSVGYYYVSRFFTSLRNNTFVFMESGIDESDSTDRSESRD